MVKLCKDCKHFQWTWKQCRHPELVERLTGASVAADRLRKDDGECGKEASFFEPK
jgi:hypothetical protein